jgi:hypothetical protein
MVYYCKHVSPYAYCKKFYASGQIFTKNSKPTESLYQSVKCLSSDGGIECSLTSGVSNVFFSTTSEKILIPQPLPGKTYRVQGREIAYLQ